MRFIQFTDIERVTNIGRPRWIFTPKIISKRGTKIAINWGITDNDYHFILATLENHYVKVSDYVWQIYTDR